MERRFKGWSSIIVGATLVAAGVSAMPVMLMMGAFNIGGLIIFYYLIKKSAENK